MKLTSQSWANGDTIPSRHAAGRLAALGYRVTMTPADRFLESGEGYKGRFLRFSC